MAIDRGRRNTKKKPDYPKLITDYYLVAVCAFFPLAVSATNYGYEYIIEAKSFTWFFLTGSWVLLLIGSCLWARRRGIPTDIHFSWHQWTALGILAVSVLSAALSDYPKDSFTLMNSSNTNSVLYLASYVAAFLGISWFGSFKRHHIWALAFSSGFSGIVSLLQFAGYNPLHLFPEGYNYFNRNVEYAGEYLGTIGNADFLAAFLCFVVPFLLVYALRSKDKRDRLLLVPAGLSWFVLWASGVDAGKVGLIGCAVIAVPVVLRNRKAAKGAAAVSLGLAVAGAAVVYFWPSSSGILGEASQILHGQVQPSFGHDRVSIWMESIKHIPGHVLLGNGPASGCWLLQNLYVVNEEMNRVSYTYNVHNVYLGYLMENGIFVFCGYLALALGSLVHWIRARNSDTTAAVGTGLLCYLIQDFFNLGMITTAPYLWISLSYLLSSRRESKTLC